MATLRNPNGGYDPAYDLLWRPGQAIGGGGAAAPQPAPLPQSPASPIPSSSLDAMETAGYTAKGPAMALGVHDAGKLANQNDPKYVFLRAAQGLGMNDRDELLNRLKADPSGFFKNASWSGNDKLVMSGALDPMFKGISAFDVIRGADIGGKNWSWEPVGGRGGAGGSTPKPTPMPLPGATAIKPGSIALPGGGGGGSAAQTGFRGDLYKQISSMLASGGPTNSAMQSAQSALQGLIDNGGKFDQDLINSRMESAREGLDSTRRASLDQARAEMADRGIMGYGSGATSSGPEATSILRTNENMQAQSAGAYRDIYNEEADAANNRYASAISQMTGLGTAQAGALIDLIGQAGTLSNADEQNLVQKLAIQSNMSIAQAQLAFDQAKHAADLKFNYAQLAQQGKLTGQSLANQRYGDDLNYSLGLGRLGLDRDVNLQNAQNPGILAQILSLLGGNANTAAGGYI